MILVIMYIKTFKTDIIVYICHIKLTDNFQYQSRTDGITLSIREIEGKSSNY